MNNQRYRDDRVQKGRVYLGEPEFVAEIGQVVVSQDKQRKYTRDGGVWAIGDKAKYKDYENVLNVDLQQFEVEEIGPGMLDKMARLFADKARSRFPVLLHYGTLITRAVQGFGWEPFLLVSAITPERMGEILNRFGEASLAVARGWAQVQGVELVVIHDDIATTKDVLMSPDWYRKYAFPWYRRIFAAIHAEGCKALYISDGNYLRVLDDILTTAPDGLYIESTSMDPRTVMQRAGKDKLYLVKSNSRYVDLGTPEDIYAELQELRKLHAEFPGTMMYRGGGNPKPGNAEAFERYFNEFLVYN